MLVKKDNNYESKPSVPGNLFISIPNRPDGAYRGCTEIRTLATLFKGEWIFYSVCVADSKSHRDRLESLNMTTRSISAWWMNRFTASCFIEATQVKDTFSLWALSLQIKWSTKAAHDLIRSGLFYLIQAALLLWLSANTTWNQQWERERNRI